MLTRLMDVDIQMTAILFVVSRICPNLWKIDHDYVVEILRGEHHALLKVADIDTT